MHPVKFGSPIIGMEKILTFEWHGKGKLCIHFVEHIDEVDLPPKRAKPVQILSDIT